MAQKVTIPRNAKLENYWRKVLIGAISALLCLTISGASFYFKVHALGYIFGAGFIFELISLALYLHKRPRPKNCPQCQSMMVVVGYTDDLHIGYCKTCDQKFEWPAAA